MKAFLAAWLGLALAACQSAPRPLGELLSAEELASLAIAGDARGLAVVTPRGAVLTYLSDPYQAGASLLQASDHDGLVIQPAFSDGQPAAYVTTERWREFPRVWAQPVYLPVTGFDPATGPIELPGAFPVFGVGTASRFSGPFWQVFYVMVPAGTAADGLRSGEDVLRRGLALTQGPLLLSSIVPRTLGLGSPSGLVPRHPFTGDALPDRLPEQAWLDGELVFHLPWGRDRFRLNPANNVITEVALFHLALAGSDGVAVPLPVPPVIGTGAFGAPRSADAPLGVARFGALRHAYSVLIAPRPDGSVPGIFVPASRPRLRQDLVAKLDSRLLPVPGLAAERLVQREQYTLRVAVDGRCFGDSAFPDTCTWLDTQQSIEGNLPASSFTDEKVFTAGPLLLFDGVAP